MLFESQRFLLRVGFCIEQKYKTQKHTKFIEVTKLNINHNIE